MNLILPGDPGFYETLSTPPPGWRSEVPSSSNAFFIVRKGSELLQPVSEQEYIEYSEGGEFEERWDEIDDSLSDEKWELEQTISVFGMI